MIVRYTQTTSSFSHLEDQITRWLTISRGLRDQFRNIFFNTCIVITSLFLTFFLQYLMIYFICSQLSTCQSFALLPSS